MQSKKIKVEHSILNWLLDTCTFVKFYQARDLYFKSGQELLQYSVFIRGIFISSLIFLFPRMANMTNFLRLKRGSQTPLIIHLLFWEILLDVNISYIQRDHLPIIYARKWISCTLQLPVAWDYVYIEECKTHWWALMHSIVFSKLNFFLPTFEINCLVNTL